MQSRGGFKILVYTNQIRQIKTQFIAMPTKSLTWIGTGWGGAPRFSFFVCTTSCSQVAEMTSSQPSPWAVAAGAAPRASALSPRPPRFASPGAGPSLAGPPTRSPAPRGGNSSLAAQGSPHVISRRRGFQREFKGYGGN